MTGEVVTELTSEECWEMLRDEEFGRLAYRLVDAVHITPINYAVESGSLLFRTAEGNKLLAGCCDGVRRGVRAIATGRTGPAASSCADLHACFPKRKRIARRMFRCGHGYRR
jgi:hypothetical protein